MAPGWGDQYGPAGGNLMAQVGDTFWPHLGETFWRWWGNLRGPRHPATSFLGAKYSDLLHPITPDENSAKFFRQLLGELLAKWQCGKEYFEFFRAQLGLANCATLNISSWNIGAHYNASL